MTSIFPLRRYVIVQQRRARCLFVVFYYNVVRYIIQCQLKRWRAVVACVSRAANTSTCTARVTSRGRGAGRAGRRGAGVGGGASRGDRPSYLRSRMLLRLFRTHVADAQQCASLYRFLLLLCCERSVSSRPCIRCIICIHTSILIFTIDIFSKYSHVFRRSRLTRPYVAVI